MQAILSQIPKTPKVAAYGGGVTVARLVRRDPEDALAIIRDNVKTVFGPKARTVSLAVIDDMTPIDGTKIDMHFIVVDDVLCDLDGDESMPLLTRMKTESEYKKATLRRIRADEEIRQEWLDEDVSGPLAFESPDTFIDKIERGHLIEMIDDVGTYILDTSESCDFYCFYPHEPLVVTFIV